MAKWVKLPDDAQVTMSRESWESTRGIGFLGKVGIAALAISVLWLFGHTADDHKPNTPRPTHSAPVKVRS
jgi:hypothetical protein